MLQNVEIWKRTLPRRTYFRKEVQFLLWTSPKNFTLESLNFTEITYYLLYGWAVLSYNKQKNKKYYY